MEACKEVTAYRAQHEASRQKWRGGDRAVVFPFGTYGMRVAEAAPPEDAIIARPGPTTADVRAELARDEHDRSDLRDRSERMLDEVREAFTAEAAQIVSADRSRSSTPTGPPTPRINRAAAAYHGGILRARPDQPRRRGVPRPSGAPRSTAPPRRTTEGSFGGAA